ncbi:Golgi transport complex COD1 protein [Plasmopara halstedii]|uniref:Golgi transport complex COD1 protein n=1 Tax=Plasmopara halstedii TaxID=4781 RepID=A0A0P1B6S4_PLAHL|nr:Golgi transport complex COD1 protein [Plasmopara halstedii]CEG50506.1 Golgi transport complex COD1 protein [Plasmopara halstedii]|eukprot:XP_024586875.1 Golgi transport complex COD1 protein [Plasmopara halstedii]
MTFEESVTSFYVAFAEQQLDQVCQALSDMRIYSVNTISNDKEGEGVHDEMLRSCETKALSLQDTALSRLQTACERSDVDADAALTAFSHCVALGAAHEAASKFSRCLKGIFDTQARASFNRVKASKQAAKVNEHGYFDRACYVEAISEILTGATDIMNAVADVTTDLLVLKLVLEPIHASCAGIVLEIVQTYAADARIVAWERRANVQAQRDPKQALQEDEVEADESLQMIDLILDELASIIRVLVSYTAFLITVCEGLGQQDRNEGFEAKVHELSGVYVMLERFYVFQSVHKATVIAEPQELEHGVYVSSVVEDVSFVLNKAFFRASQCLNYHTALSIVIVLVDALESQYLQAVLTLPSRPCVIPLFPMKAATAQISRQDNSSDAQNHHSEISFSDILLRVVDEDLERTLQEEARHIMTINSAYMSGEFVSALQEKIDEFSSAIFATDAPILECLPTPIQNITDAFRSIVSNEIQEVLARTLHKRLPQVLNYEMDEQLQYVLTSAQYDALELQGSLLVRLVEREVSTNSELQRYERVLCRAPFEDLVEAATQYLTSCLESALFTSRKRFNDLGALQLEREITDILTRISSLVPHRSLRRAFTRLFQVIFVLNLVQPSHVLDYVSNLRNEFTPEMIETLLRMRVEFQSEDIMHAIEDISKAK